MKHIIWDFNGTLLNDAQLSVDLDNDVFDQIGVPRITLEDYRNNMTMPVRDFYPRVGVDYAKHSYEEIARLWLDEFNKRAVGVGLIPGVLEAIKALHAQGRSQSVLSASYEPSVPRAVRRAGADPVYEGYQRPAGRERRQKDGNRPTGQLRELGLTGADVVLVGDMLTDAHLAEALGADCVLVSWGHNDLKRLNPPVCRWRTAWRRWKTFWRNPKIYAFRRCGDASLKKGGIEIKAPSLRALSSGARLKEEGEAHERKGCPRGTSRADEGAVHQGGAFRLFRA